MSIKYLDMYSGIGGFPAAVVGLGGIERGGFCGKDKYAKQTDEKLYDTKGGMEF